MAWFRTHVSINQFCIFSLWNILQHYFVICNLCDLCPIKIFIFLYKVASFLKERWQCKIYNLICACQNVLLICVFCNLLTLLQMTEWCLVYSLIMKQKKILVMWSKMLLHCKSTIYFFLILKTNKCVSCIQLISFERFSIIQWMRLWQLRTKNIWYQQCLIVPPGNKNKIKNIFHSRSELFTTYRGLMIEMPALETIYSDQFTSSTHLIKKVVLL